MIIVVNKWLSHAYSSMIISGDSKLAELLHGHDLLVHVGGNLPPRQPAEHRALSLSDPEQVEHHQRHLQAQHHLQGQRHLQPEVPR